MTVELSYNFDLNELIFARKNKEYGAYKLRKAYKTYLSISMWIVVLFFILTAAAPTIYRSQNPEIAPSTTEGTGHPCKLTPPPSIGNMKVEIPIDVAPPIISTIKFTPPIVKPDDQVRNDDYIPTITDLKDAGPGTKTLVGSPDGIDFRFNESEETIVEEAKEAIVPYSLSVEEMPEPVGGIAGIQSKIVYPEIAKRAGVDGKVVILAFVDEIGNVNRVEVQKGLGAGLDEAALHAVKQTKFKPGKQNGVPVKVQVSIPIVFKLQ